MYPYIVSLICRNAGSDTTIPQLDRKREEHLSSDGMWRSFPKVLNLIQCVNSGVNFGRNKINNKVIQILRAKISKSKMMWLADFDFGVEHKQPVFVYYSEIAGVISSYADFGLIGLVPQEGCQ